MLFHSISFAVFLPVIFIIYWALPHRYRWLAILLASYYFYMSWNPKYIILIFFVTAISYLGALGIENSEKRPVKKLWLATVAIASMGLLFVFKYWNFAAANIVKIAGIGSIHLHPLTLKLILPVGISFYTFQTLSYIIDVFRGTVKAERHFGKYAAFISFFPQLVAGPIERTENLLPQIKAEHRFEYGTASYGLKLMAWGFFKKLVIADNLAVYTDRVFGNVYAHQGSSLLLASVFFTFQIYCDFSGYSDIAIGTANLFGIQLMKNFKSPYFSSSIKEFWKRWHISLSSWFQDYVYIPLGGNRVGMLRGHFNVILTFLASGLWHGAAWHYILWGGGTWALSSS